MTGILLYTVIFIAKVIEVSISTTRMMVINKGEKLIGSVLAFFEISIWVCLAGSVLTNITADPFKAVAYALGFSIGNYVGSILEAKIGLGTTTITAIVDKQDGDNLIRGLQANEFGVTVMRGNGLNSSKDIIMAVVPRKKADEVVKLIKTLEESAFITIADTKPIHGGFGLTK